MGHQSLQRAHSAAWALVRRQHGVITRRQLLDLGFSPEAIKHRITKGRLHPTWRGVYAVGRPQLTRHGRYLAAVLRCGPHAALSHECAGEVLGIHPAARDPVDVSVPAVVARVPAGIVVHRRKWLTAADVERRHGIPLTNPTCTLIDLAARLDRDQLEAAISEADKRDLVDPDELRAALHPLARRPGLRALRDTLDRPTFVLTDSQLERRFLPIARRAGLPAPLTRQQLHGWRVDFYWPHLGLVVETDGLRYHRTPLQQERDHERDQAHVAAGLTTLRFTHGQVTRRPRYVRDRLAATADHLGSATSSPR